MMVVIKPPMPPPSFLLRSGVDFGGSIGFLVADFAALGVAVAGLTVGFDVDGVDLSAAEDGFFASASRMGGRTGPFLLLSTIEKPFSPLFGFGPYSNSSNKVFSFGAFATKMLVAPCACSSAPMLGERQ